MKRLDMRLMAGLLLIVGGLFYLLNNLGIIRWGGLVWAAAAAVARRFHRDVTRVFPTVPPGRTIPGSSTTGILHG